jgi:putative two-component system response regulator
MRILIVDDDPAMRALLRRDLERGGHEVLDCPSGLEAFERVLEGDAKLVITDWDMPGIDGLRLTRMIRGGDSAGYTYVILVTAHDSAEERVRGLNAGADDFICKPWHRDELLARVQGGERVLALESRNMTILALAKLAESRDTDTGHHIERVRHFARRLAREAAMDDALAAEVDGEFLRLLFETAPLHDIGKVAVPDSILLKPGRLTDTEMEVMRTHTVHGAATLQTLVHNFPGARFLTMALEIARSHHERWDGTGYPDGLAGEAIPLAARVVAIADVYDALTSERVYKAAMPHDEAVQTILRNSGSHFDPRLVDAFRRCAGEFRQIASAFSEGVAMQAPRREAA